MARPRLTVLRRLSMIPILWLGGSPFVRMLVPPVRRRREMDRRLVEFFYSHRPAAFRRAISDFCAYYELKPPRIEWYEYIDWGRVAGKTFEDGRIHLVHPENWRRGRVYKSERMWVQTVYHELAHYLFWADAERKAEAFTSRMVRGLRQRPMRRRAALKRLGSAAERLARRVDGRGKRLAKRAEASSGRGRGSAGRSVIRARNCR